MSAMAKFFIARVVLVGLATLIYAAIHQSKQEHRTSSFAIRD